jgi:signal transduction histidine kinase
MRFSLNRRILGPLWLLFILGGIGAFFSIWILFEHRRDSLLLNVAGRQRMLILLVLNESLSRDESIEGRSRFKKAVGVFEKSLKALRSGGAVALGFEPKNSVLVEIPPIVPALLPLLNQIESQWGEFESKLALVVPGSEYPDFSRNLRSRAYKLTLDLDVLAGKLQERTDLSVNYQILFWFSLGIIALFCLVTSILYVHGKLIIPLQRMAEVLVNLTEGRFVDPIKISGKGVIQDLSRSVNRVSQTLRYFLTEMRTVTESVHHSSLDRPIVLEYPGDFARLRDTLKQVLQLGTVVEHMGEGVLITDIEGCVQYANPAYLKFTLKAKPDVIGRIPPVLERESTISPGYDSIWDKLNSGESWSGRFTSKRADNSDIIEALTVSPVMNAKANLSAIVLVSRDCTLEVEAEVAERRSLRLRSMADFAGGISHVLNNTLAVMLGHAELIAESTLNDKELQASAKQIVSGAQQGAQLTRQLLILSDSASQSFSFLELQSVISDSLQQIAPELPKNIQLTTSLKAVNSKMHGEPNYLRQLVLSLCYNARIAMLESGGLLSIGLEDIVVEQGHSNLTAGIYLRLLISDTGEGMHKEVLERVFEPFFSGWGTQDQAGLGLATAWAIVNAHRGSIAISSQVGQGTQVEILLPMEETLSD